MRISLVALVLIYLLQPALASSQQLRYVQTNFPPWFISEDGNFSGIDVLIVKELAKRLELKLAIDTCPIMRCFSQMRRGRVDMMSSLFKRPEREEFMYFIEPFYFDAHDTVFYVKRGRKDIIKTYDDLYKLSVGVTKKISYGEKFDNDKNIDKEVVSLQTQLPKMLMSGRIDAFLGDETVMDYLVITAGFYDAFEKTNFRIKHAGDGGYFAIARSSPFASRINEFNSALQAMINDGTIEKIIDDFYAQLKTKHLLIDKK